MGNIEVCIHDFIMGAINGCMPIHVLSENFGVCEIFVCLKDQRNSDTNL